MKNKWNLIFMLAALVLIWSCQKEETEEFGNLEKDMVQDNQVAENTVNDILTITDQAGKWGATSYKDMAGNQLSPLSSCATITHDTLANPHVLTIDFGTTNCLCNDGRYRRGKILATHTGPYGQVGTVIHVSFQDYFVNDRKVLGTKTITNMGENNTFDFWFTILVDIQIVSPSGTDTLTYTAERTRTWIEGKATPTLLDDVYLIEGTSTGTKANGSHFVMTILQALRKEIGCPQFVSGVMQIDRTNKPTLTVDFGSGDCDGTAVITVNGNNYTYGF